MANTTLSFYSATHMDPIIPSFPQAYGFNTLLLSNESSAKLDAPFPDYVESIQVKLRVGEAYVLSAPVFGTVTSYNKSIESYRNDNDCWSYYINQMYDDDPSGSQDEIIGSGLYSQDIFVREGQFMVIFMNNLQVRNTSWIFAGFVPASIITNHSEAGAWFKKTSMLFQTQRKIAMVAGELHITLSSSLTAPATSHRCLNKVRFFSLRLPSLYLSTIYLHLLSI